MTKCLVTKLNGIVNNDNLPRLGCLKFFFPANSGKFKISTLGDVEIFSAKGEKVIYGTDNVKKNRVTSGDYFIDGAADVTIYISNKYKLTKLDIYDTLSVNANYEFDISELKYCVELNYLSLTKSKKITGDISVISNLPALTSLSLLNTQVSGDISGISNLPALTSLNLSSTQVSGDISGISNLPALTSLNLADTQVSGDISGISNLPALTSLNLAKTQVSGDISGVSSLSSLTSLNLSSTNISGDISGVSSLSSLTSLSLERSGISGDISSLGNMSKLTNITVFSTQIRGTITGLNRLINLNKLNVSTTSCSGNLKDLCSAMATTRKTGKLTTTAYSSEVKIDNNTAFSRNDVIATFSDAGVSYSGIE